jgi:hypothetical protein
MHQVAHTPGTSDSFLDVYSDVFNTVTAPFNDLLLDRIFGGDRLPGQTQEAYTRMTNALGQVEPLIRLYMSSDTSALPRTWEDVACHFDAFVASFKCAR